MTDTSSILLPEQLPECTKVHWMPFGIAYDGPISTSAQYFEPVVQQRDGSNSSSTSQQWEAHFRGRQLTGVSKALPKGFQGLVLKPTGNSASNSTSDAQQRSWQAVGSFQEVILWGHDAPLAATDPAMRCIDWLALADKVHQLVSVSQVEDELERMRDQGVVS